MSTHVVMLPCTCWKNGQSDVSEPVVLARGWSTSYSRNATRSLQSCFIFVVVVYNRSHVITTIATTPDCTPLCRNSVTAGGGTRDAGAQIADCATYTAQHG